MPTHTPGPPSIPPPPLPAVPPQLRSSGVTKRVRWIALGIGGLLATVVGASAISGSDASELADAPTTSVGTPTTNFVVSTTFPPAITTPTTQQLMETSAVPLPVASIGAVDVDRTIEQLNALVVAEPDPTRPRYVRDEFMPGGWGDPNGDCRTVRHDVLFEASETEPTTTGDGCRVETGRWTDPYTGEILSSADEATIDHRVALAEAHRSGAWRWDLQTKQSFSHDPTAGQLSVVGKAVNQSKSDRRPDQWLPPRTDSHCTFVSEWVGVKHRWKLTVVPSEVSAIRQVLATCESSQSALNLISPATPAIVTSTSTAPTTTTIVVVAGSPGSVTLISCNAHDEVVRLANFGDKPISLAGFTLHDEGDKHGVSLGQFGSLQSGASLKILTGPEARASAGAVVWKRRFVWNNDGDIAFLIAPDGSVQESRC